MARLPAGPSGGRERSLRRIGVAQLKCVRGSCAVTFAKSFFCSLRRWGTLGDAPSCGFGRRVPLRTRLERRRRGMARPSSSELDWALVLVSSGSVRSPFSFFSAEAAFSRACSKSICIRCS